VKSFMIQVTSFEQTSEGCYKLNINEFLRVVSFKGKRLPRQNAQTDRLYAMRYHKTLLALGELIK